jgi:ubiquinone/menaquinone biosynthesis C-methylase UbiE
VTEPAPEKPVLEQAVSEHDYLLRLAASDLGRADKSLAAGELAIRPGDVVLDLGCGPGADRPAFAEAVLCLRHALYPHGRG